MNHVARKARSSRVKLRNLENSSAIKNDTPKRGIVSITFLLMKDVIENRSVFASDNDNRPWFLQVVLPPSSPFLLLSPRPSIYVYKLS